MEYLNSLRMRKKNRGTEVEMGNMEQKSLLAELGGFYSVSPALFHNGCPGLRATPWSLRDTRSHFQAQ